MVVKTTHTVFFKALKRGHTVSQAPFRVLVLRHPFVVFGSTGVTLPAEPLQQWTALRLYRSHTVAPCWEVSPGCYLGLSSLFVPSDVRCQAWRLSSLSLIRIRKFRGACKTTGAHLLQITPLRGCVLPAI